MLSSFSDCVDHFPPLSQLDLDRKDALVGGKPSLASMTQLPESPELYGFKPVYLPNSSQPCQCSACVGAVAALVTGVSQMSEHTSCVKSFQIPN